jgi:hypothetical protein
MSEIFQAKDLTEALALANKFKLTGKYNLFRGQSQDWPVMSSLGRLLPDTDPEVQKRIERLFLFFDANPNLHKYKLDVDWFWAVAQHHGLPTNYIDFTSNPAIAAFFATNSKSNISGKDSVIVCLDESDWQTFMSGLGDYFKRQGVIAPYITRIEVDNLWRLQAQEGCFMFSPYNNIEFFYDFDRIVFPYSEPYNVINKNQIYPKRKSELEQMLDQYFNMEGRIEGAERFRRMAESINMPVVEVGPLKYNEYFKRKQKHRSWRSEEFKAWDFPLKEQWSGRLKSIRLQFDFDYELPIQSIASNIHKQIVGFFRKRKVGRETHINFSIKTNANIGKKELNLVNRSCSRVWEGMRHLPYSDDEIIKVIIDVVITSVFKEIYGKTVSISGEDLLLLEMTNEYGNSTKCRVSPSVIMGAFRNDLNNILADSAPKILSPEILLHINDPFLLFDFHELLEAFKREMICYQVLRQRENELPVIFFTPAQIKELGYA